MRRWPLNRHAALERWSAFDPGQWIDFNPTHVQLPGGQGLALIRRDQFPPVPGKGTIWAVAVDARMQPQGRPQLLVARGEDPRAVVIGTRLLLFYCVIDRDAEDRVSGATMKLAEFDIGADATLTMRRHFELPKNPLGLARPGDRHAAWEKNWVPFAVSETEVALIYSHDPWHVIVLDVDPASDSRRFKAHHAGPALKWRYGQVRGGTPPRPFDDQRLITFFHSSLVVGSRKIYVVGAATFDREAPHTPRAMTLEPLWAAPYHSGAHRFGWRFAGSVVFPLGAERTEGGWRLLAGIDDGEIASFEVPHAALADRLQPLDAAPAVEIADLDDQRFSSPGPLWLRDAAIPAATPLPVARFVEFVTGPGGTVIDTAPGDGSALLALAPSVRRVLALASAPRQRSLLARNLALNGIEHAGIEDADPARLDALDLDQVDALLVPRDAAAVVAGAAALLARWRPAIVLRDADHAALRELLQPHGYTLEPMFPFDPEWALALPAERRAAWSWWV